ncbi:hypothetical protein QOT17_005383 [Balamuthia mandrillaris]
MGGSSTLALVVVVFAVVSSWLGAVRSGDSDNFSGRAGSVSVIVSTRNDGRAVTPILEGVEASLMDWVKEMRNRGVNDLVAEVIIVDDNSTDDTAKKVDRWIKFRKSLKEEDHASLGEEERLMLSIGYRFIHEQSATELGHGTSKNIGVSLSQGDMLFFADSRGFFLPDHIRVCHDLLVLNKVAYAKTGVETGELTHEDKASPINMCIWRKVHEFIEGFPEQAPFVELAQVHKAYQSALSPFPWVGSGRQTVTIELVPDKEQKRPPYWDAVLSKLTLYHMSHVREKISLYKRGEPLSANPYWAINHVATQKKSLPLWKVFNTDNRATRYRGLMDFGDKMFKKGEWETTRLILQIIPTFVYNPTEIPKVGAQQSSTFTTA